MAVSPGSVWFTATAAGAASAEALVRVAGRSSADLEVLAAPHEATDDEVALTA